MYACESWTIKKAEYWSTNAFFLKYKFIYFNWRLITLQVPMVLNCGVEEDSWESLGLQGDQANQS